MAITTKATIASFGGKLLKLSHQSRTLGCEMAFNLYLPPPSDKKVPVLIYLSGLTCTPDNCSEKGFFQHGASKHGIAILYPDTSPRNVNIKGEDDSYDFGSGAGFYIDASAEPWSKNYRMYSYISTELPETIFTSSSSSSSSSSSEPTPTTSSSSSSSFTDRLDPTRISITGHSMGGHGALTLFLKNPGRYKSCSAFAPICNPLKAPWGQKAFKGYFGEEMWEDKGREHDATELIKGWKGRQQKDEQEKRLDILIDVGTNDNFYTQGQLLPENLVEAAKEAGLDSASSSALTIRYQDGYDHSYFTMASFADDHVQHAAKYLFAS